MRVQRYFAFADLSGFTAFTDQHGDQQSVELLITFRGEVRRVTTDFGVRIAKWLGDGCMFVSVDPTNLVAAMLGLEAALVRCALPLHLHAGLAGGQVILLEGDDYIGGPVNLASRLCDAARSHQMLATAQLARHAPQGTAIEPVGRLELPGFLEAVDVVRLSS